MRRTAIIALAALSLMVVAIGAQDTGGVYINEAVEVPKLSEPPTLDGVRGADEWAGAAWLECSVSKILADGNEYGWIDIDNQSTVRSVNQLRQSDGESAAEARTDADIATNIWHAWDDEAMYYVGEARDNLRDVEGTGTATNWWERDSFSLYVDLQNTKEEVTTCCDGPYTALNIVNFVGTPQNSSSVTVTWERTIQSIRESTQDADIIEGLEYGYRDAIDEFGGDADYVIEGKLPWETLQRFNLPDAPTAGAEVGFSWIILDPDGDDGFGGQIQCNGWADNPASYSTFVFSNTVAGPGGSTPVSDDSWGRIKTTFQ